MMNQKLIKAPVLLFLLLLTSAHVSAANETLKTGAFIINMGVLPQTIGNGLKPHGMIYDLVKNFNVPIKWSINPAKARDGIDFTYNAVDYKGGPFIVPAEYRSAAVNARIAYWQTQGVVGVTTTAPITIPIYTTIYVMPVWTLDLANGAIAAAYFVNAGIPTTAYNSLTPAQLTACNDLFVMPHADPTWAAHGNLLAWNKNAKGAIWVACHAVSVLENVVNPANAAQKMNFLSTPSLILNGSHANGTIPYSYNYPTDVVMQFMGNIDLAQQNGSEQIYLPTGGGSWRPGVKVGVYDATQANVPVPSPGPAATLVYGYGFDDPTRGRVMYEGGHSHNKGTADDVSAQRAFFNFSMMTALEKAIIPTPTTTIALNDTLYSGTTEAFTFSLPAGSNPALFPILWSTNCGGTFSPNATQQNVTYMPPTVTTATPCLVSVQVTDSCGRKFSNARSVTVLCPMNVSNTATNVLCNGAATGSIKFTATSSTAPYSYNWTRGVATGTGTTTTIPSLIAGTYNVTVTSATGCNRSFTQILTEPPPLSINAVSTNILCKGAATGAIDITVSSGNAPYTYNWGGGITTEDRANLLVGTYNLTVTDAIGCTKTTSVIITEAATLPPAAPVATVVQPTCAVATGTITVTSPLTGVTYSFDNGLTYQASATSSALAAGTYQVMVKSTTTGCISVATAKIINPQPAIPPLPITSVVQPTCTVATGVITVTSPSTGVTYSFNNGGAFQTSAVSSALVAGTYQVIVKNTVSGCSSAATPTTINVQPSTPSVPVLSATAPTCTVPTATITITAPTGAGMTYSIDGIDYTNTTGIFNGVPANTYTVKAKSAAGCVSAGTSITIVPIVQTPVLSLTQPNCLVSTGGAVATFPTGAGYTYSIDGVDYSNTTGSFTNLAVNTYTLTAKNASNCVSAGATFSINPPVQTPIVTIVQPTCTVATGVITVTSPSTGVTYSFDNGTTFQASPTSNSLAIGGYQVIAKDIAQGCLSAPTSATINPQPAIPSVPTTSVSQPTCTVATGTITVTSPSSGVTYSFDNGATYQATDISGALVANTYQVVVKDNTSGCASTVVPTTVNAQPATPSVPTSSVSQPTCTVAMGTITVSSPASGVTYSFDNGLTYQATATSSPLAAGVHQVVVKDNAFGCASASTSETINPQPAIPAVPTTSVSQPTCTEATGTITVTSPSSGVTYSFDNGLTYQATDESNALPANTYQVVVKDNTSGCASTVVPTIINAQPSAPSVPTTSVSQPTCTVATGTITVTSPSSGVTYSFDNGITYQAAAISNALTTNTYQVVVKDNTSGCASTMVATIINVQPSAPSVAVTSISQPTCTVATGTITVTSPSSGVTYSFDNGITYQAAAISNALPANTYQVVVKDNTSGCTSTPVPTIVNTQPPTPLAPTVSLIQTTCTVGTGTITVTAPLGLGISYSIDGLNYSNTTGVFTTVSPNAYAVTVQDVSGCISAGTSVTINSIVNTPTVSITQPTCTVSTGTITVTAPLGAGFSYSIDGVDYTNTTGIFTNLSIATYNVTAKNSSGCTSVATSEAIVPPLLSPTFTLLQPNCATLTGTITVTTPLGAGMTYSIDGVNYTNTTGVFTALPSGTYNVTAKSSAGCLSPATPATFIHLLTFNLKVLLEGPFQTATGTMQTLLNQRGLLPGQIPIGEFGVATPIGQPYKIAPWSYAGTEGDTITTYPPTVVDWVLVSLRADTTSSTNVFQQAGWLHSDGHISFSPSCFPIPNGSYFVLIEHRNHVGVLSANKVAVLSNVLTKDFTLTDSYIRTNPPSFGQKQKGTKWMMFAGDGQKSTPITNYDINFNDSQLWKIQSGIFDQYIYGDFNMDADVNFSDSFLWKLNSGKYSGVVHW